MSNPPTIITRSAYKNPKNKKVNIATIAQIISLIFLLVSTPQALRAEEYKIPQFVIDACIIASPFIAAAQIGMSAPTTSDDILKQVRDLQGLYDTLNKNLVTPEKCRTVLPQAIADLDRFMFRQHLGACSDATISAMGTDYSQGNWFCDTLDADDWRRFRDWMLTAEGREWLRKRTGLEVEDVFSAPPPFDASKYAVSELDLNQWQRIGFDASVSNDAGFRVILSCQGEANLRLQAVDASVRIRELADPSSDFLLYFNDPRGGVIDSFNLSWSEKDNGGIELPIGASIIELMRIAPSMGLDNDPFGVQFSLSGAIEAISDCKAPQEVLEFGQDSLAYKQCQDVADRGAAADVRRCIIEETHRHDLILNASYQCLRGQLSEKDFIALRDAQRDWISDTKKSCAFTDTQGSIAADFRVGCRHDAVREKSEELARLAAQSGCPYVDVDDVAIDLDRWWNAGGDASVSNADGQRLVVNCQDFGRGLFKGKGLDYINQFDLSEPLNFSFTNSDGQQIALLGLHATWAEGGVEFPVTSYLIEQFRAASTVTVTDRKLASSFSLSGSSLALNSCEVQVATVQESKAARATAKDLSANPLRAVEILQEYHSGLSTCVDIRMESSLDIRSGTALRQEYDSFCNPTGHNATGILLGATRACALTSFGQNGHTLRFFEHLKRQGKVIRAEERNGAIFAHLKMALSHEDPNHLYVNNNGALCGKFTEVEYQVRLRDLQKIGNGYFRAKYTVRQISQNPDVAGVLFKNWNPTLTRTLIFNDATGGWQITD